MIQPDDGIVNLIRNTLFLKPGVRGFFDWNTATIRINCNLEDFRLRLKLSNGSGGIQESITHENYHFVQVLICGYLHKHCGILRGLIDLILKRSKEPADKQLIQFQHKKYLASSNLMQRFSRGLNVISIIEGAVYFSHTMTHQQLSSLQYLQLIKQKHIPNEYKKSYFIFYDNMNVAKIERHHFYFPFILQLSLCFEKPQEAFFDLMSSFLNEKLDGDMPLSEVMKYCENNFEGYIGWSWESGENHPIYDETLKIISEKDLGELLTSTIMNLSLSLRPEIFEHLKRPIILNPSESKINPAFKDYPIVFASKIGDESDARNLILEMALGKYITEYPELIDKFL